MSSLQNLIKQHCKAGRFEGLGIVCADVSERTAITQALDALGVPFDDWIEAEPHVLTVRVSGVAGALQYALFSVELDHTHVIVKAKDVLPKQKFANILINVHSASMAKAVIDEAERLGYLYGFGHKSDLGDIKAIHLEDDGMYYQYKHFTVNELLSPEWKPDVVERYAKCKVVKRVKNIRNVVESLRYPVEFPFVADLNPLGEGNDGALGLVVKFTKLSKDSTCLVGTVLECSSGYYNVGDVAHNWTRTNHEDFKDIWMNIRSYGEYMQEKLAVEVTTDKTALSCFGVAHTVKPDTVGIVIETAAQVDYRPITKVIEYGENSVKVIASFEPNLLGRMVRGAVLAISKFYNFLRGNK